MRLTSFSIWFVFCLSFCACSTLQQPEGIDVALVNVRLNEATLWETTAVFTVRISNETPEPITIDGSAQKFYLNGIYVGEGLASERIEVPRLNSTTQEISVHLRNLAMATRIRPILEQRAMDYRMDSTLYVVNGSRSHGCHLVREGRVSLQDFQPNLQGDAKRQ
jgi:LEA14-like dessication related protein